MIRYFSTLFLIMPATAFAAGAPAGTLVYAGMLTDAAGLPIAAPTQIKVAIYGSAEDDGNGALCASKAVQTDAGAFTAPLDKCDAVVHGQSALWAEVTAGKSPMTVMPRVRIGAVPFALEAASASVASGELANTLAAIASQVAALAKQVAAVASAIADVAALQADVAALKSAGKLAVQQIPIGFGSGSMVEFTGDPVMVVLSGFVTAPPYGVATSLQVDGQAASAVTMNFDNYGNSALNASVLIQPTAGKHYITLGGVGSSPPSCVGTPKPNCTATIWMLP